MIDKPLAELSKATVWMPTQVLTDKVGARNSTNVGLRLKDLEKNGSAVSRSRMEFGTKVIEWRHADKPEVGDFVPARAMKVAPVVKKSLTTEMPTDKECCNAAKVVATTASSHVAELRQDIKQLMEANCDLAVESDNRRKRIAELMDTVKNQRASIDARDSEIRIGDAAIDGWLRLANEYECKSIPELRVFINAMVDRVKYLKAENIKLLGQLGSIESRESRIAQAGDIEQKIRKLAKQTQPRRPFSVTGLVGYHAGSDNVTLFLDRRLSARSITLPADKLVQLADMAGG